MEVNLLNRDQSCSFTVSVNKAPVKELQKQVRIDELYRENFLYLHGKFNNWLFLT